MEIKSKTVQVGLSPLQTSEFLADVKNFEQLMPENISKFEMLREDAFVFALKGMPEIALEIKEVVPSEKVVLGAMSDKLPFTLTGHISEVNENTSQVMLEFSGDFNAMMAMMIKSPITKFLETLTDNLAAI